MRNQPSSSRASLDDREPDAGEDRLGKPQRVRKDARDDGDDADDELGAAQKVHPLPLRESEEEELSEADILEEHDMEELDADDLARMQGPDA